MKNKNLNQNRFSLKKTRSSFLSMKMLFMAVVLFLSYLSYGQVGTWAALKNKAPQQSAGLMLVLTDGRILCQDAVNDAAGDPVGWMILTPDAKGSYLNGTWTTTGSNFRAHLFCNSQVLPSGKVMVAGGEYGDGDTTGEVYDPVAGTWSKTGPVYDKDNIYDGNSELLYNGIVLSGPQAATGDNNSADCLFWSPKTNQWTSAPTSPLNHDEAEWLKMPDSTVMFIGIASTNYCTYNPVTNKWISGTSTVPGQISDKYGEECGPGVLLPNGKAVFFGGDVFNALYTPGTTKGQGTWAAAAPFPTIGGGAMGITDGPGVMMPNGKILVSCSPIGTSTNNEFLNPAYFTEYDYTTNTFTQNTNAIPGNGAGVITSNTCSNMTFLQLPDGTVLVDQSQNSTAAANEQYFIYTPGSAAIPQGKPVITSIIPDACPLYKITGKLFNGISEGSEYGDDLQMASNYPLVRLTNTAGNVYYCKTTNWNRIGAVMTDSLMDTAIFQTPTGLPAGTYSLQVVVNGFASNPTVFTTLQATVYTGVSGTATCNGVLAATPTGGLPGYTYTWKTGSQTTDTIKGQCAGTYCCIVKDADGCKDSVCGTISVTTGIANINSTSGINLYPDPNSGYFTLTGLTSGEVVDVYNEIGQQVQHKIMDNNSDLKVDISSYPNGVYFIRINATDGTFITEKKAIKAQ